MIGFGTSIGIGDCGVANSPGILLLEMDNLIVGYLSPYNIPNCFDKQGKENPKSKGQRRKDNLPNKGFALINQDISYDSHFVIHHIGFQQLLEQIFTQKKKFF